MSVILETSVGDITIDLFTEERPISNFFFSHTFVEKIEKSIQQSPIGIAHPMNLRTQYLNLNSLLVKRQIDNPSPGAVTGGN